MRKGSSVPVGRTRRPLFVGRCSCICFLSDGGTLVLHNAADVLYRPLRSDEEGVLLSTKVTQVCSPSLHFEHGWVVGTCHQPKEGWYSSYRLWIVSFFFVRWWKLCPAIESNNTLAPWKDKMLLGGWSHPFGRSSRKRNHTHPEVMSDEMIRAILLIVVVVI